MSMNQRVPEPTPLHWEPLSRAYPGFQALYGVEAMPPFLMSLVSNGDGWAFITSAGAMTAGRISPERAIFPYQSADKLLARPDLSGAFTLVRTVDKGIPVCWEPWGSQPEPELVERALYKHGLHTELIFEETNRVLGLRFTSRLGLSARYGLVRSCRLEALDQPRQIALLDGWRMLNVPGVSAPFYAMLGYLAEAYARHECCPETGLGIFTLNARIVDCPQAAESLRTTAAWCAGLPSPVPLLSARQTAAFRRGEPVQAEREIRGEFGCYLTHSSAVVTPGQPLEWVCAADTWLDHSALVALRENLRNPSTLAQMAIADVAATTSGLRQRLAAADALQAGGDVAATLHHTANVLFNSLRGGLPQDGYQFPSADVAAFLESRNRPLAKRHAKSLGSLPALLDQAALRAFARNAGDPQLERLAAEYLPLSFSRRHGDPSRPWNTFTIQISDEQGRARLGYEGNWRDIFQNWEALAFSYPGWLENMVNVFLNATTADGYNPYRINRNGVDWEVAEHGGEWSHLGYWGDHQIIYLARLLEAWAQQEPQRIPALWREVRYVCSDIPYRIKPFADLCTHPAQSIVFDHAHHSVRMKRAEEIGGDGKLLARPDGEPLAFSFAEKLLVPVLAKLSNLVPGGGIWMNTQRPEWNDANNALAGWGLSVVTTAHLHQHVALLQRLADAAGDQPVPMHAATHVLLEEVSAVLASLPDDASTNARARRRVMERLGHAGEHHRKAVYANALGEMESVASERVVTFLAIAQRALEQTLAANRRDDGLYHSYNVLHLTEDRAEIRRLDLMLEGQVALLGTRWISPSDAASMLDALAASPLYRKDQDSYRLYPDRAIKSFLDRNTLPDGIEQRIPLLAHLVQVGDLSLVVRDIKGRLHFNGDFAQVGEVRQALARLGERPELAEAVRHDRSDIEALWEETFQHALFTGRSTTFFAFEGLGSIYWHMVAKLLLATQEQHDAAVAAGDSATAQRLALRYERVQNGLGYRRSPASYGAFPPDPYSHTPQHRGAQQPGMTGQVKEEILARWGELGVRWQHGQLHFTPTLLRRPEFTATATTFAYLNTDGQEASCELPPGSLAFTIAQVPVRYRLGTTHRIIIERPSSRTEHDGGTLSEEDTRSIRWRTGEVRLIDVELPAEAVR